MIPAEQWKWYGMPGHLIVSASCCFHMVTHIGQVRVSSIGCYHKPEDPKDYDHRSSIGTGADSLYETFVFPLGDGEPEGESGRAPLRELSEIDAERYATEAEAENGHAEMCRKWAALDGDPAKFDEAA